MGIAQRLFTWKNLLRIGTSVMAVWGFTVTGWLILGKNSPSGLEMMSEIKKIEQFLNQDNYSEAFLLAEKVEKNFNENIILTDLWSRIGRSVEVSTVPSNANLSLAFYTDQGSLKWRDIGSSPITEVRLPRDAIYLRIQKEGYNKIETLLSKYGNKFNFVLDKAQSIPKNMIRISGGKKRIQLAAYDDYPAVLLPAYLIDQYEVTNKEYKEFIDAGGYNDTVYWKHFFENDGQNLSWAYAIEQFRDRTGRLGPSSWEGGTYPNGEENYPVSGVSWYEALAYSEFRNRSLPTVFHWLGATQTGMATFILPHSNFSEKGTRSVHNSRPGPFGTYDMAGNIKEWCFNKTGSNRFILGAAWNEPTYMFFEQDARSPMDRSENNGFRTVDYLEVNPTELEESLSPINRVIRDYTKESPASDELYKAYLAQFEYDSTPLNITPIDVDEISPYWIREIIEFDAAYGGERMRAHLFIPRNVQKPYQTVIYLPGSNATRQTSSDKMGLTNIDLIVKSGRAVIWPVYKDTYERFTGLKFTDPNKSRAYVEHVIWWIKDIRRSLDYLETRSDIDMNKIAYYGTSWGARIGNIALAVEPRINIGILVAGGFPLMFSQPEVAEITYASRVSIPVILITGIHDRVFPYETSQKPMFDNLGTTTPNKHWVKYNASHGVRSELREQVFSQIQEWLDKYFGSIG
jgi:dienelactone hydrolase